MSVRDATAALLEDDRLLGPSFDAVQLRQSDKAETETRGSKLAVPALSELGIAKADFLSAAPLMAEQALASGSPGNNPVVPSLDECERLYEQVYA